jgi:hypothetical protein
MPIVVAIITTLVMGIPIALAVDRNARGPMLVGLAYLYGTGVIYAVMLTLAVIGAHWTAINVTAIALLIAIACFAFKPTQHSALSTQHFSFVDLATFATAIAYVNFATIAAVWEWDFWAIWGLKARVFFEAGTIDWRFLASRWNEFAHADYPLLLPLNYAYGALLGGGWSDRWLGLFSAAFGIALLLIVRGLAALETRPIFAAAIAFAVSIFALTHSVGMAEAPLVAFAAAGLLFVRRAVSFGDDAAMRHGALLLGLAAVTKNEGIALLVAVAIALAVTKRSLIVRLWPALAIVSPWLILRAFHHLSTDLARGSFVQRAFERLGDVVPIVAMLLQHLAQPLTWLTILLGIMVVPREERARERFVFVAFAVQLVFYVAVYFGTPNGVEWHIATSWQRLTLQLAPPVLYVVMVMLARTYDSGHAEARSEQP